MLVPKITPTFEAGRVLVADITTDVGAGTTELHVVRPRADIDARFIAYLLRSQPFLQEGVTTLQGVGNLRRVPKDFLGTFAVAVESPDGQRAIADYLDHETAQIDRLIAKQEQLIATLRERRDAVWARSMDGAQTSGPEVALRHAIVSIVDGPFGSSLTSAHYSDDGARVVRLGNIGVNEFRLADEAFISLEYFTHLAAHSVEQGDVVVAGLGDDKMPLGRAAVVPSIGPAIVKADCYRLRLKPGVDAHYLAGAMSSPQTRAQIGLLARGATRARLNTTVVQTVRLPLPPLDEQHRIVAELDEQTSKIDALIEKAEQFIALAKERRAALITAAVTGQIAVPGFDPAHDTNDETSSTESTEVA